nr:hypothetical protein [Lentzea indica]
MNTSLRSLPVEVSGGPAITPMRVWPAPTSRRASVGQCLAAVGADDGACGAPDRPVEQDERNAACAHFANQARVVGRGAQQEAVHPAVEQGAHVRRLLLGALVGVPDHDAVAV